MAFRKLLPLIALLIMAGITSLAAAGCSLAADVTPPAGYQPPTAAQPIEEGPVYPLVAPDPAGGAAIFVEKCAPCHGEAGGGDGEQAAKLSVPVPAIGSAAVSRPAAPSDWYWIVTHGNLERFMPGFSGSLSDQQRWDVIAYVYSLSSPAGTLATGKSIYDAACAECHGLQGEGGQGPAFTDQEMMAALSNTNLFGKISVTDGPHNYSEDLTEEARWAVISYTRSFSLGLAADLGQASVQATPGGTPPAGEPTSQPTQGSGTPPASDTVEMGSVHGTVMNGSGGEVPSGLVVTLRGYDEMKETYTVTSEVEADGSYSFPEVEMPAGRVFLATVDHSGTTFNSDIAHSQGGPQDLDLPIVVFDSTSDTTGLVVSRMHVFFDFNVSGSVQVVEMFIVSNPTDKVIVPVEESQSVLSFDLPEGAANLQFQDGALGERYLETSTGFGDRASIAPGDGQHQVLFAYDLPYERKLELSLPLPLAIEDVVVMVPEAGVKAQSSQLVDGGPKEVQGMKFQLLNGGSLNAGDELSITLSGRPRPEAEAGTPTAAISEHTSLYVGLGVFGLALILAGVWLFRRRSAGQPEASTAGSPISAEAEDADSLMEAIIALDDQYRAGKIPDQAYQQRRAELKEKLRTQLG